VAKSEIDDPLLSDIKSFQMVHVYLTFFPSFLLLNLFRAIHTLFSQSERQGRFLLSVKLLLMLPIIYLFNM